MYGKGIIKNKNVTLNIYLDGLHYLSLASYVLLLKEYEDDETVVYKFGSNEEMMGKIELNKVTKKVLDLQSLPEQNLASTFYFD